jgi:hypothetical protein
VVSRWIGERGVRKGSENPRTAEPVRRKGRWRRVNGVLKGRRIVDEAEEKEETRAVVCMVWWRTGRKSIAQGPEARGVKGEEVIEAELLAVVVDDGGFVDFT